MDNFQLIYSYIRDAIAVVVAKTPTPIDDLALKLFDAIVNEFGAKVLAVSDDLTPELREEVFRIAKEARELQDTLPAA